MIQAKELRIGNKALYKNEIIEVVSISGLKYSFDRQDIIIHTPDYQAFTSVDILKLSPIPLTSELLEKYGFKSEHPAYYYIPIGDDYLYVYYSNSGLHTYAIKYMHAYIGEIESLHRLQNLYFALTGEELEIALQQ